MQSKTPKRSPRISEGGKLEFRFTKDGLYIVGDKRGLLQLASVIRWVSRGQDGCHSHLGFRWKNWMKARGFAINFDFLKKRFLRRATPPPVEVTIMMTDDIKANLPQ
jgi:hypothetical protein